MRARPLGLQTQAQIARLFRELLITLLQSSLLFLGGETLRAFLLNVLEALSALLLQLPAQPVALRFVLRVAPRVGLPVLRLPLYFVVIAAK